MHLTSHGYVITWVALIVLATLSLLLSFIHFEPGDLIVSLVIAAAKAFLVLWFFMHLAEERFSSRVAIMVALGLMGVLIALVVTDVATRHTFPARGEPTRSAAMYEH
jgi:cytochrome c oxidase subunit 4